MLLCFSVRTHKNVISKFDSTQYNRIHTVKKLKSASCFEKRRVTFMSY